MKAGRNLTETSEKGDLQSIWFSERSGKVSIIDQRHLPHRLVVEEIDTLEGMCTAIREMHLRGAPLIGVAAAYGMYLACREAEGCAAAGRMEEAAGLLRATRPTAVNLAWAVERQLRGLRGVGKPAKRTASALATAREERSYAFVLTSWVQPG